MAQTAKERIRFACEQCDQLLSIGATRIGQHVNCPKCGSENEVPDAEAAALQIADRKRRKEKARRESAEDFSQFEVYDDDTEFIFETEDDVGYYGGRVDRSKVAVPRYVLYTQGALLGSVAIGAFVLGWVFGAVTAGPDKSLVEDNTPRVIRGELTYVDQQDREQPDAGSVVILVPQESRPGPNEKVSVAGLRPDDPMPEEDHPGLQRISVMGGAYARTNAEGEYRLQVPQRGRYFMLVISGNSTRSGNDDLNKEHLAQMGRYFTPATDLIGDRRFRWSREEIGRDMTLDHTFGES